ncbi:hypothetical protein BRADI_4g39766v3 [Brachypodium distachyon]|uniref:RWP-RK domain-containing protein n=1 Tax=Brachypodium distachyon TaxID=15368 RepID=A0A0Q3EWE2_BRADI|nr:hypothetical protein BRADI_4g39766v3 [Brachypodium distachyon]
MASGDGGEEEDLGMFVDALPLPDDFDDVLHLLDIPVDAAEADPPVLQPPLTGTAAAAVPVQQQQYNIADCYDYQPASTHGLSGNARPYWPRTMFADGCYSTGAAAVHGEPSTSAADCSGCQVLREVVHSNGLEVAKLCIHGGAPGVFNHAMSEVYPVNNNSGGGSAPPSMTQHSCIDFRGRDYDWVRHYLTEYALRLAAGNYAVVSDSLSVFHDVLCTDMNTSIILLDDDGHESAGTTNACRKQAAATVDSAAATAAAVQPTIQIRNTEPDQPAAGPSQPPRCATDVRVKQQPLHPVAARSALALQRERTGKMKFDDIAPYFHLPIVEAAEKLDVCATVLKGICRRVGVQRWPHRKVKKIRQRDHKTQEIG